MIDKICSNEKLTTELILANKKNALESTDEKDEVAAILRQKAEKLLKIRPQRKILHFNEGDILKLLHEFEVYSVELEIQNEELTFQNVENEKRASELLIVNKELAFQIEEKEKRAAELIIANKELLFQNNEKEKRAAELISINNAFSQSEENFHRSISESPFGIRIISVKGETIYVNKAFLDIFDLNSLEDFKNMSLINSYSPESYSQHLERKENRKNGNETSDYKLSIIGKNGEIRFIKVWRKEILWNKIKHYQLINFDITKQKKAVEALKSSQQQLRNFASHLENIREEEKIAIAREIHDDLGQILVALKIDLGLFKNKISKGIDTIAPEEISCKFNDLSCLVDKTIKTTRRIMTGLRPEIIDSLGFIEATKSYVLEFEDRHHLPCQFTCTIPELNTTPQQSVALFRILQEVLNNVIKHAKATAVKIYMTTPANKLILEIKDNGIGFDENHKVRPDSYGMIGMKERVILLDGKLTIKSKTGKGTSVKIEMPYLELSN